MLSTFGKLRHVLPIYNREQYMITFIWRMLAHLGHIIATYKYLLSQAKENVDLFSQEKNNSLD